MNSLPYPCTRLYCSYNADLERVVRTRGRRGRHFPIMKVIPPGLDFSNLKVAAPPDPWDVMNAAGLKGAGGSGHLGRGPRRSSASGSWALLAGGGSGAGPSGDEVVSPAAAADGNGEQCVVWCSLWCHNAVCGWMTHVDYATCNGMRYAASSEQSS